MIKKKTVSQAGNNLLFHSIAHGDIKDVIGLLEDKEADVNAVNINGSTPVHYAIYYENNDILEVLLKYGANPNVKEIEGIGGCTPIHRAVEKNNYELVQTLLKAGADPNITEKNGFTTLHLAARKGYKEIAKLLIDSGVDTNKRDANGYNASYWAKTNNFPELLEMLPPPAKISLDEMYIFRLQARQKHDVPVKKAKKKKKKK